jgi:hypothetical protein
MYDLAEEVVVIGCSYSDRMVVSNDNDNLEQHSLSKKLTNKLTNIVTNKQINK